MCDYIKENKQAWEEAFNHSSEEYTNRTVSLLKNRPKDLFTKYVDMLLERHVQKNDRLVQFCCNNGRETLASLSYGFRDVVGFDIASNMVDYASNLANELSLDAMFVQTNILEIDDSYHQTFDVGLLTIGALPWFKDLQELFAVIAKTLKVGAYIIIEDMHPITNMLAAKDEDNYQSMYPTLLVNDYFRKTPWVEVEGMGYMTKNSYHSKKFTSFSHPFTDIINGLIVNGFEIRSIEENNIDQSNMFGEINNKNIPLTFVIEAKKIR